MKLSSRLAALLVSSLAFTASAAFAQSNVPFKATFTIDETLHDGTGPDCPQIGMISGHGNASHLGRTVVSGTNCVTLRTDTGFPVYHFSNGNILLMAANGDTITGTIQGSFIYSGKGKVFTIDYGSYSFNRGTGRFSAATGSGKLTGTQDLGTNKGQLQATGTISY